MEQLIMERLTEMLMTGTVRTEPEAARLIKDIDDEIDILAQHALVVARAIADGKTGEPGIQLSITTRFEVVADDGEVDIIAVETEIGEDEARHTIGVE